MTPAELTTALNWRYATKQFQSDREIPADAWEALLSSLHLAPSSFGLQPWQFIVVEDPSTRDCLRQASWGQPQVTNADKLVVFTSRRDITAADIERWISRLAEVQGQTPDDFKDLAGIIEGFSQNMPVEARHAWNVRQAYVALGQFMTAAAVIGVDTCPLEGIDPAAYDTELGLTNSDYATCVACVAGYRDESDRSATRPKARFPREDVIRSL